MSKDYNHSPKYEPRHRKERSSSKSGYLVILIILGVVFYYAFSRGFLVLRTDVPQNVSTKNNESVKKENTQPAKPRFEFYTLLSKERVPVPHEKNAPADVTTDTLPPPDEAKPKASEEKITKLGVAPTGVPDIPVRNIGTPSTQSVQTVAAEHASVEEPKEMEAKEAKPVPQVTTTVSEPISTGKRYMLQVAALRQQADAERLKAQLSFLGFDVFIEPFQSGGNTGYRVKVGPYNSMEAVQKARQMLSGQHMSSILITLPGK